MKSQSGQSSRLMTAGRTPGRGGNAVPAPVGELGASAALWAGLMLAVVVAVAVVVGLAAKPADAQAAPTFQCDGTPYLIQDLNPAPGVTPRLTKIDTSETPFKYSTIDDQEKPSPINGMAYRATDNYLYAARWATGSDPFRLVKLDAQGNVFGAFIPSGLPALRYNHGAMDQATGTYYLMDTFAADPTQRATLYKVNLANNSVTSQKLTQAVTTGDFAFNPADKLLYGVDETGRVVSINPANGTVNRVKDPILPGSPSDKKLYYSGAYFNAQGDLFALRGADGENLFQLNVKGGAATAQVMSRNTAPPSGNSDAAACYQRQPVADLSIELTGPQSAEPGGGIEYTAQVFNAGPDNAEAAKVTTTLPAGVTFRSANGAGWNCSNAGDVVTCTRNGVLPLGSAPPITITATAPAVASGTLTAVSTVSSTTPDPVTTNNRDETDATVPNRLDAVDDAYATDEDTPLRVGTPGVLRNDTDANGDKLTVDVGLIQQPKNGTVAVKADGSFVYTPNKDFSGTDTFEYTVSDGKGTDKAIVTITVRPVNDAPVARDDSGSTAEAEAVAGAFISQYVGKAGNTPTRLFRPNTEQQPYTFDKVGEDVTSPLNAIGYRMGDDLLYGYRLNTGKPGVVRVDPETGASKYLGVPRGMPAEGEYIAGDVGPNSSTYYLYATRSGVLRQIDLGQSDLGKSRAKSVPLSSKIDVHDLAVSPVNGLLYGVDTGGRLVEVDPGTGKVRYKSVSGLKAGTYGAAWFTKAGSLIAYENGRKSTGGTLNVIGTPDQSPVVISNQAGPATFGNDGAAFVGPPRFAGLSVEVDVLANDGDPDGDDTLDKSTLRVVQGPQHGVVRINSDLNAPTVTYTSGATYLGSDSFRYEVCDAPAGAEGRQCAQATVTITSSSNGGLQARRETAPEGS